MQQKERKKERRSDMDRKTRRGKGGKGDRSFSHKSRAPLRFQKQWERQTIEKKKKKKKLKKVSVGCVRSESG